MLVIKRILSVILSVFATVLLIAPFRSGLEALSHFMAGQSNEGFKSTLTTTILLLICLVIFQVARSIWKDRRAEAILAMNAPVAPLANPFGEAPPPLPPSQEPAFSGPSFAPGDR